MAEGQGIAGDDLNDRLEQNQDLFGSALGTSQMGMSGIQDTYRMGQTLNQGSQGGPSPNQMAAPGGLGALGGN